MYIKIDRLVTITEQVIEQINLWKKLTPMIVNISLLPHSCIIHGLVKASHNPNGCERNFYFIFYVNCAFC